jgi:outer membrane protein assembly factor BamB
MRYLALVSARTGKPRPDVPDLSLSAAVPDGRDGWFVGGALGLARMRADGKIDPAWGTAESRAISVCHLVRVGSRLYVEGSRGVQAFDVGRGQLVWTGPKVPPFNVRGCGDRVYALAASSTRVYVGGDFTRVGVVARRSLAALDARTGRLLAWQMPPLGYGSAHASVEALAFAGTRLYVGGLFGSVGGRPQSGLAALDPRTGDLLLWKPRNGGQADHILVTHGEVLTAGFDTSFTATSARTGRALGWTSGIRGARTFAADGPLIYLGADLRDGIQSVDGHPRNNLAAYDLVTGHFTSWAPNLARYVMVGTIAPSGEQVLILAGLTNSVG